MAGIVRPVMVFWPFVVCWWMVVGIGVAFLFGSVCFRLPRWRIGFVSVWVVIWRHPGCSVRQWRVSSVMMRMMMAMMLVVAVMPTVAASISLGRSFFPGMIRPWPVEGVLLLLLLLL